MIEPQKLKYNTNIHYCKEFNGPTIKETFPNYTSNIELSLEKVFESCQYVLKISSPEANKFLLNNSIPSYQIELSNKKHAYLIFNTFISSFISTDDDQKVLFNTFFNYKPLNPMSTCCLLIVFILSSQSLDENIDYYIFYNSYLLWS